jgi:hypothetical protein
MWFLAFSVRIIDLKRRSGEEVELSKGYYSRDLREKRKAFLTPATPGEKKKNPLTTNNGLGG